MTTTAYQIYGSFVVYLWVYRSASSTPFGTINTLTSFVQFSTLLYRDDLPDTYKFMSPFLGDLQVEARRPPFPRPTRPTVPARLCSSRALGVRSTRNWAVHAPCV